MRIGLPISLLFVAIFFFSCKKPGAKRDASPKINQIQVLGSHNSYKKAISPFLLEMLRKEDSVLAMELDYAHAPLSDQLELGLRQLELDLFYDPEGGRFSRPLGQELLKKGGQKPAEFDPRNHLEMPGFKVFHIQDIDYQSHCLVFIDCLASLLRWSEENRDHLPILITINPKVNAISRAGFDFTQPLPFSKSALDSLDEEILAIIPREKLIVPDDIRSGFASLEVAVKAGNWPTLEQARGKFLLAIDAAPQGDVIAAYLEGHPSLQGRVMFVNSLPNTPHAAFMVMNNPLKSGEEIKSRVREGYLVRTRADAGTREARKGDYSRFEAALKSGAQYISTDYYIPDHRFPHNYTVKLDSQRIARCNPVFPGLSCDGKELE